MRRIRYGCLKDAISPGVKRTNIFWGLAIWRQEGMVSAVWKTGKQEMGKKKQGKWKTG